MQDCDAVFHIAGWYKIGHRSWRKAELINVEGTRNVLSLAHELGVPRIIYTSSVVVYGDTHGFNPDESYAPAPCSFLTEYDRTKHLAYYHVAVPLISRGAPITIVMPGGVYGPGDASLIASLMRLFYRGWLPVLPGPNLTLCYAHVDDVAEGHILAYEKGGIGETYHLTGPALSLRQVVRLWADITGRPAPVLNIPAALLKPFAPLVDLPALYIRLPDVISKDTLSILDATYLGKSDKAQNELGWRTRPLRDGFSETLGWIAARESARPAPLLRLPTTPRRRFSMALGAVLGGLAAWWLWGRSRR
jgi:nucleoside-diphosphate-sugar epimerase